VRWESDSDVDEYSGSESNSRSGTPLQAMLPGMVPFGMPAPKQQDDSQNVDECREAAISRLVAVVEKQREEAERQRQSQLLRRNSRSKTLPTTFADQSSGLAAQVQSAVAMAAQVQGQISSPERSCIILDWDDTLFPSWYVQKMYATLGLSPCSHGQDTPVATMCHEPLSQLAEVVSNLLRRCRQVARVAIVTLAQRPWVETSARTYLHGLDLKALRRELDIPVYYARECIRKDQVGIEEEGVNMFVIAKRNAMVKCLSKLRKKYGCEASNILSIGDSTVEHDAIKDVVWSREGHNLCKSVLLMNKPSIDMLNNELRILCSVIGKMVAYEDDFDFTMDNGNTDHLSSWCQ